MSKSLSSEFEEEDHPSDALLRIRATGMRALFAAAARATFALMTDLDRVELRTARPIACAAPNREELLAVWLNELIGAASAEALFFREFDITHISDTAIEATARGEAIDTKRHALHKEVKAATYHRLSIRDIAGAWEATVLLDL
ncbi:MAG: archease [bacterium]